MDDHSKLQLIYKLYAHMCVIAKSYRYVQNVKDWRYEFIDQDIINCILKCLIALMGYTQMLQRLNAKICKTFYCCNLQYEKKIMPKFILNISFYPFCTRHKIKWINLKVIWSWHQMTLICHGYEISHVISNF